MPTIGSIFHAAKSAPRAAFEVFSEVTFEISNPAISRKIPLELFANRELQQVSDAALGGQHFHHGCRSLVLQPGRSAGAERMSQLAQLERRLTRKPPAGKRGVIDLALRRDI